jgi:chitinase
MSCSSTGSCASRASVLALTLAIVLGGCATSRSYERIPVVGREYRTPGDFRVVGYFPSWSGDPDKIQYRALTHINYAFVAPTKEGEYYPVDESEKLGLLVAYAHAFGVRVLASLGGGSDGKNEAFRAIAADPSLTAAFCGNTMALLERYDLDGIDMDWEFPSAADADGFALLMSALADALHAAHKLLTIAVGADEFDGVNCEDSVIASVDFLNIMAYDYGYGQSGVHHSTYAFAQAAMNYWLADRGVPADKVVLGLPFYGRSLVDRHSRTFKAILAKDRDAPGKDVSGEFGYNGFATLRAKTLDLARALGGGVMVWQLNQDASGEASLLNAIFDAVKEPWRTAAASAPK